MKFCEKFKELTREECVEYCHMLDREYLTSIETKKNIYKKSSNHSNHSIINTSIMLNALNIRIYRYWEIYAECKFGDDCSFVHGDSELKQRKLTFDYKTKPCK